MANTFEFQATGIDGKTVDLAQYKGRVLLIVNTASNCGFTPQYKGLETVYEQFKDKGAVVLGFPCNQFGAQEPGSEAQIGAFCEKNYGVMFPLFAKVDVNGDATHPLFAHLKQQAPGLLGTQMIKWNFTKFLVGKNGRVYKRYAPATAPQELMGDIETLLSEHA